MQVVAQHIDDILSSMRALAVDWRDPIALRVIDKLRELPAKREYSIEDVASWLDEDFDDGMLIARLFLGLSKDQFTAALIDELGREGSGKTRFKKDRERFLEGLATLGILNAMEAEINKETHWSDTLVERLRSGRGSAISGQRRGRDVEDFAEELVKKVFEDGYSSRCNFIGARGRIAKCDFAIPSKDNPRIVIESKGYGATGSKQTDVIGDIEKIIAAKRSDTAFLFLTDGLTWRQRQSDLKKIVDYQNNGDITRIYTLSMADQFEADLHVLKAEMGIV